MGATGSGLLLGVAAGRRSAAGSGRRTRSCRSTRCCGRRLRRRCSRCCCCARRRAASASAPASARSCAWCARARSSRIPLLFAFADRFTVGFFTSTFPLMLRNLHALPPARIGL